MNIPVLSVYDAQGNEIPIPAIQGPPGQDGSDAEVTAENIAAALGYTPADEDDLGGKLDTTGGVMTGALQFQMTGGYLEYYNTPIISMYSTGMEVGLSNRPFKIKGNGDRPLYQMGSGNAEDIALLSDLDAKAEIDDTAGDGDTDKTWSADKLVEELDSKIDDAPSDNKQYARKDGAWAEVTGGSGGDTAGVVAPAYDAESTYSEGDLVIQNQLLYEANQDIDEPEAWNPAHWTQRMASEVFARLQPIIVTCLTQDGVTVTGQTVTLRNGSDATAPVWATTAYEGQPVTFMVLPGFDYFVSVSDTLEHHFGPTTASGTVKGAVSVTLTYNDVSNIATFEGVVEAITALEDPTVMIGNVEIEDTWEADNGTIYDDPMIVVAIKDVKDADGETHKAAIMQRKWATLNAVPFDAAENEEATETNALEGVYYAALDGNTFTKLSLNVGDPIPYGDHEKILHNGIDFNNDMMKYGYSDWGHSFYRKYLNSSGEAGSYEASHVGDVLPSQADTLRGYMAGCSPELLAAAKQIEVNYSLGGGKTTIDTFWLPSATEMYGSNNSIEGPFFQYWKDATGFSSPSSAANNGRIQYALENHTLRRAVRVRTAGGYSIVYFCKTTGELTGAYDGTSSCFSNGLLCACPCCAIY